MKRLQGMFIAVILALAVLGCFSLHAVQTAKAQQAFPTGLYDQKILDASLQIAIYSEDGRYYDQGLGTAVKVSGETLIVTHNHWTFKNFLKKFQKAQILNARHELLLELDRSEFINLIIFSNPGTLILQAPDALNITPVEMGDFRQAKTGDTVTVVHQNASNPSQLDLLQAEVRLVYTYRGCDIYHLVAKEGEKIVQGDSGGGIWLDGQLVANSWGIFNEQGAQLQKPTQVTVAAQFPQSFLWVIEDSQADLLSGEEVPVMSTGKDKP